jgi:phospholipid/cholesterol/gamma-HCH transport system substrate-binding protein
VFKKMTEVLVGLFMLLGIIALVFLALKVSGLTGYSDNQGYYKVTADFDNVGSLKVRSPVMVAGVSVGEVASIRLNKADFRARVTLLISKSQNELPVDTSASIYTQGLLGSNYVSLSPGYTDTYLKDNGVIDTTNSAVILEKLIGQFLYSYQKKSESEGDKSQGEVQVPNENPPAQNSSIGNTPAPGLAVPKPVVPESLNQTSSQPISQEEKNDVQK